MRADTTRVLRFLPRPAVPVGWVDVVAVGTSLTSCGRCIHVHLSSQLGLIAADPNVWVLGLSRCSFGALPRALNGFRAAGLTRRPVSSHVLPPVP